MLLLKYWHASVVTSFTLSIIYEIREKWEKFSVRKGIDLEEKVEGDDDCKEEDQGSRAK